MAVARHHLAAQSAIAVVYPHVNGIGGDSFWLLVPPSGKPVAIDACGAAAGVATIEAYRSRGHTSIPVHGPLAANTVAGTIGGWLEAQRLATDLGGVHTVLAGRLTGGFGPHHTKHRRQQAAEIPAPTFHRQTGDPR